MAPFSDLDPNHVPDNNSNVYIGGSERRETWNSNADFLLSIIGKNITKMLLFSRKAQLFLNLT